MNCSRAAVFFGEGYVGRSAMNESIVYSGTDERCRTFVYGVLANIPITFSLLGFFLR